MPKLRSASASVLGRSATVHAVTIAKPTDYPSIFSAADQVLSRVAGSGDTADQKLCIHLSPGTPAMTAIWLLLGKTKYPATFFQSYNGEIWETEVPFDLVVDFVPELLRAPDSSLQHLAARSPQEVEGFEDIVGQSQAIRLAVGRAQKARQRSLYLRGLMERVGRGTYKMVRECRQFGMRTPEWKNVACSVRLTLFAATGDVLLDLNERQKALLEHVEPGTQIVTTEFSQRFVPDISARQARRDLEELEDFGFLSRSGVGRGTTYTRTGKRLE